MKKAILNKFFIAIILLFNIQLALGQTYSDENDNIAVPFATSTLDQINNGKANWYTICTYSGKYWAAKDNEVICYSDLYTIEDCNMFCFVGDNVNGFQIYCKQWGSTKLLYCASSTSHEPLIPTNTWETQSPNTFKVSKNADGFNFYYPGNTTACINDLHGDGILTLWTNSNAPNDTGCRMYLSLIEGTGEGGNTDSNLPFIPTTISNGKFATNTHWYTMTIRGNKKLTVADWGIDCLTIDEVSEGNLWCFEGNSSDGFKIYNHSTGVSKAAAAGSSSNSLNVYMGDQEYSERWHLSENPNGGYNIYHPESEYSCWNDFGNKGYIALWNDNNSPLDNGSNITFEEYDIKNLFPDEEEEEEEQSSELKPVTGEITYVYLKSGEIYAFPTTYLNADETDGQTTFTDNSGNTYIYKVSEIDHISNTAPADLPIIESFKFNNKFNDMLMVDAAGVINEDNSIDITVGGIGKRLVPSIKLNEDAAEIYVGKDKQESKVTSRRFTEPTTYTITRPGMMMLRETTSGSLGMYPFGRDYVVNVTYLCDKPTTEYGIPIVEITTKDGTMISSRDYYWEASIKINGAGYYPDLENTPMLIKGRGNSSWSNVSIGGWWESNPKNPYRIKFAEKKKPLGMTAGKNWNLIANSISNSMTTNMVGSRIAEMVKCAGANHFIPVELYINGDYRGSYCLTEKVGFANNSVDLDDESNAALIELDQYYSDEYKFKTDATFNRDKLPVNIKYPNFAEDETNLTQEDIENSFNAFANAVKENDDLAEFVDIPALARYLMVNDMIVNQEIMHPKSTYCYNENILEGGRYVFGPAWDFDWAFGYEGSSRYFKYNAECNFYTVSTMEAREFIYNLRFFSDEMDKHYYRVWDDFVKNHLDDLLEYCQDYYDVARRSYDHDNTKWWSGDGSAYETTTNNCITWLKKRANYVYNYLSNNLGYADKGYLEPDEPEIPDMIETASAVQKTTGIYNLMGHKIDNDLSSLPKGIYIINGKKVYKK